MSTCLKNNVGLQVTNDIGAAHRGQTITENEYAVFGHGSKTGRHFFKRLVRYAIGLIIKNRFSEADRVAAKRGQYFSRMASAVFGQNAYLVAFAV